MYAIRSDLSTAAWRKSSYSNPQGGECVEIADHIPGTTMVRDSKNPDGPVLAINARAWAVFVAALRR
ncbi:DUF397 domain-containing protein [Streptomyces syringium]|uniref:DUF397 domain-containing protein n=1 Tax=Streptomyces syringium TaxID=76729 RepID=UPI0033E60605